MNAWFTLGFIAIAFLLGAGGAWYVKGKVDSVAQERALAAEETKLVTQCDQDKAITAGVSHDLQIKATALAAQLDADKRVYAAPTACMYVAQPSGSGNAPSATAKPVKPNGINPQTLLNYAARAEKYRLQLIACQGFVTQTWAIKK